MWLRSAEELLGEGEGAGDSDGAGEGDGGCDGGGDGGDEIGEESSEAGSGECSDNATWRRARKIRAEGRGHNDEGLAMAMASEGKRDVGQI